MNRKEIRKALRQMANMLNEAAVIYPIEDDGTDGFGVDESEAVELAEEVMNKLQEMFDAGDL